jgi:hypothetical protein
MKTALLALVLFPTLALANPPKPSHSSEAPWVKPLPEKRDAEFQKQIINGDEVIVDSRFNWMWQNKVTKKVDWYDAYAGCENSTYGGFSDWRLPSYWQMQSIVSHTGDEAPFVYSVFSSFGPADVLWSRDDSMTIDQPDNDDRWTFHTKLGMTTWELRELPFDGVCVRGVDPVINAPSGAKRFVEEKPDLIKDLRTGFYWTAPRDAKINKYYLWTVEVTWGEAYHYCETLSFGGMSGWRLPSVQELQMLLDLNHRWPNSWMPKLPDSAYWIWSSDMSDFNRRGWGIQVNGQQLSQFTFEKNVFGCVHD